MQVHVSEQLMPIDPIMLLEHEMDDVGAVVAMAELHESLGPDQFGRRDHLYARAEHLHMQGMVEPLIANRCHAMPRGEDQVEKMLTAEDFTQPTFVFDLNRVAKALEMAEDVGKVARLAEDIQVLVVRETPVWALSA